MIGCKIEEPALDITPELARSAARVLDNYLNKDLLELPCVIDNIVIYMRDGVPAMLACGERKYAEIVVEEMKEGMG